jgi:hypothetical protein
MAISHYPRPGQRLAPRQLESILRVPLPPKLQGARYRHLCDLDESVWTHFAQSTCLELGKEVVKVVIKGLHSLPGSIRASYLPSVADHVRLRDLSLEQRTFNVLLHLVGSSDATLGKLHTFKIADILKAKNFGAKSLVDLLVAIESWSVSRHANSTTAVAQDTDSLGHLRLIRQCKRLMRMSVGITMDDPRLERLLLPLVGRMRQLCEGWQGGKTLKECAAALLTCEIDPLGAKELISSLRQVREEIYRLRKKKLERELDEIVASVSSSRGAEMAVRYLGWDGTGTHTLQEIGDQHGLTRERVRQVCDRPIGALRERVVFAPVLERALRFVDRSVPSETTALEQLLAKKGISLHPFRLEGLLTAAEVLRKKADFGFDLGEKRIAVPRSGEQLVGMIQRTARRAIERWGAATTESIAADVNEEIGGSLEISFIADVIQLRSDFRWLDLETGWFWLSTVPRNRILTQINKILTASGRISLNELRAGVSRNYRLEGFSPPRRVLREICRQQPGFCVDGDSISAKFSSTEWLSPVEIAMARVLNDHGKVMAREEFEKHCIAAGINRATFYMYLANCPIFEKFASGIYGLRGAAIGPSDIEALGGRVKPRSKVLKGSTWTEDGKLELQFEVSNTLLATGVFSVPVSLQPFLSGEFILKGQDGQQYGRVASKDGRGWGLQPLFRRVGGESGDELALTYNLKTREVIFSLGETEDFEIFQDNKGESAGALSKDLR